MSKVLVVDDESTMRLIIAKALQPLGHELFFASDGIFALDVLRCNDDFDLLVTDVCMPVMGGGELIAAVRGSSDLPPIPILILSGVVGIHEIAHLLDLGATKFVPKPIKMESFRQDVVDCLSYGAAIAHL